MSKKSHNASNPCDKRESKKVNFWRFRAVELWKTPQILVLLGISVEIFVESVENFNFDFS